MLGRPFCRFVVTVAGLKRAVDWRCSQAVQQRPGSRCPSVFMRNANGEREIVMLLKVHIPAITEDLGLF